MRVSRYLRDEIINASKVAFGECELILFGSRADESKSGGDFDIAVVKDIDKESFITDSILKKYYDKLCNSYECKEEQFFTTEKLNYILNQLETEIEEYAPKQIKLKIFRDICLEKYESAELNYLNTSLFAVEDKVLKMGKNKLLGQPFLDNTLNADKPFMMHQTMNLEVPFPKTKEDIL